MVAVRKAQDPVLDANAKIVPLRAPNPPRVDSGVEGKIEIPRAVFEKKIGKTAFAIWTYLLFVRNDPRGFTFVRNDTIARAKDLSRDQVVRALRRLKKAGLVELVERRARSSARLVRGTYRDAIITIPYSVKQALGALPKRGGKRHGAGRPTGSKTVSRKSNPPPQESNPPPQEIKPARSLPAANDQKAKSFVDMSDHARALRADLRSQQEEIRSLLRKDLVRPPSASARPSDFVFPEADSTAKREGSPIMPRKKKTPEEEATLDREAEGEPLEILGNGSREERIRRIETTPRVVCTDRTPEEQAAVRAEIEEMLSGSVEEIPPFPGFEDMRCPLLPAPPLLPEDAPDKKLVQLILRPFWGAAKAIFGEDAVLALSKNYANIDENRHFGMLLNGAKLLRDFEIAPSQWIAFSFDAWKKSRPEQADRVPVLRFVFSEKRIRERQGWFAEVATNFCVKRRVPHMEASSLLSRYNALEREARWEIQRQTAATGFVSVERARAIIEHFTKKYFPDGYDEEFANVQKIGEKHRAALRIRVRNGEYVWGKE